MKFPQLFSLLVFSTLGYAVTNEFVPKLGSGKVAERLNPRKGCGSASDPSSESSCCGQPWNYGPPCNCGLFGKPPFSTHLIIFRRSLSESSLSEVDNKYKLFAFQGLKVRFVVTFGNFRSNIHWVLTSLFHSPSI